MLHLLVCDIGKAAAVEAPQHKVDCIAEHAAARQRDTVSSRQVSVAQLDDDFADHALQRQSTFSLTSFRIHCSR